MTTEKESEVLPAERRQQWSPTFVDGDQLLQLYISSSAIYPIGVKSLDELLEGGISSGHITEVTGASSSGKTQVCFQMCANVAGKLGQRVLYVDTTGSFCARRILEMLDTLGCHQPESEEALARISHVTCVDINALISVVNGAILQKIAILIVDSITPVATMALNSPNKVQGLGLLNRLASAMKSFAAARKRAVLVTNGQVRWREPTGQAETVKPALGRCWLHVPAVRIQLSSTSEDCGGRSAQILKTHQSNYRRSCGFAITERGLETR